MALTQRAVLKANVVIIAGSIVLSLFGTGCGGESAVADGLNSVDAGQKPGSGLESPSQTPEPQGRDAGSPSTVDAGTLPSGQDAGTPPVPQACGNGAGGPVPDDARHVLTVPAADITAGVEKGYSIQGTSNHTHNVTITAANFARLKDGLTFNVTSTSGGGMAHTHTFLVACKP